MGANGGATEDTEEAGAEGGRGAWYVQRSQPYILYMYINANIKQAPSFPSPGTSVYRTKRARVLIAQTRHRGREHDRCCYVRTCMLEKSKLMGVC